MIESYISFGDEVMVRLIDEVFLTSWNHFIGIALNELLGGHGISYMDGF